MPDRVLHTTARLKEPREIVMAVAMVRVTPQRVLIRGDGLISAILVFQQHAQVEEQSCAGLARRDSVAVQPLGRTASRAPDAAAARN